MSRAIQAAVLMLAVNAATGTGQPQTRASVNELPPETITTGACTQSSSGYLGIVEKDKKERTKLTDKETGEYVRKMLAQGYSVTLYPQASGKVFTVATCHPTSP